MAQPRTSLAVAVAHGHGIGSRSTGSQGAKREREQSQPGHADDPKRIRQDDHQADRPQAIQGQAPAAEGQMPQGELARQAAALLIELTHVATIAAAQWRETAPSQAQLAFLNNKAHRVAQVAQKAFPAVAAGLPQERVPQELQYAVTLFQQAMGAVRQAREAHAEWPTKIEGELTQITTTALQQGAAWRKAKPDKAQVDALKQRMRTVRELIERVMAGSGPSITQALASSVAQAQKAVDDAVRVANDWKVKDRQQPERTAVFLQRSSAGRRPTTAAAAAAASQHAVHAPIHARAGTLAAAPGPALAAAAGAAAVSQHTRMKRAPTKLQPLPAKRRPSAGVGHAGQAPVTAVVARRVILSPAMSMAKLLSAANALLPPSAAQPQPQPTAKSLQLLDLYGYQPTAHGLAASAENQLKELTQQAEAAVTEWEGGKVPKQVVLRSLRDQAVTAVRLWQQADACAWSGAAGQAINKALMPLASQATSTLQRASAAAQRAMQAAEENERMVERIHAADCACQQLKRRAEDAASTWERDAPTEQQIAALEQESARVVQFAREACDAAKAEHACIAALVKKAKDLEATATKAVQEAADAGREAIKRRAVEAALMSVRNHALAAMGAWEDRPPSSEEIDGLHEAIGAARAVLDAHQDLAQPSTLQQANQAIAQAWAAADAAQATHAERMVTAQHALERFTQRALLCRAAWARKDRRRQPEGARYEKLLRCYNRAMALAERAFPEAHEYVLRAEREPGAQPDDVPEEEVHAVTLVQDARSALESVKGLLRAWEYATVMQQAAVAA